MFGVQGNSTQTRVVRIATPLVLIAMVVGSAGSALAKKKKDEKAAPAAPKVSVIAEIENSGLLVWPGPPSIPRVKYVTHYAAEKPVTEKEAKKKQGWMERMGGVASGNDPIKDKPFYQLAQPYGIAVNSKGNLFVVDTKVGAVFVWDTQTRDVSLIANGKQAHFSGITGITIDDDDRIFVSDAVLHHVVVFDATFKNIGVIKQGLSGPAGMAVDSENRFLYVVDTDQDQVQVYDLDSLKLLRSIGKPGKHRATEPGLFAAPTNCAVDSDGNLFVTDTFNDRVEVFDADGNFIRTFGKAGDGPGYFARPKGIAVDSDGHVWVADSVQDRVQVFTADGQFLLIMGGHGNLPGQFAALQGIAIDKKNRVFTSEQFMGRVQAFQYLTDSETKAELDRRTAEAKNKPGGAEAKAAPATAAAPAAASTDAATAAPASTSPTAPGVPSAKDLNRQIRQGTKTK